MARETLWLALFLAGCSSGDRADLAGATADTANDAGAGGGDEESSWDSGLEEDDAAVPAWWRLDAEVVVSGGDVDAAASRLEVTLVGEDEASTCTVSGTAGRYTPVRPLPDELLVTWWSVESIAWSGECADLGYADALPSEIELGIGALHPEIEAVLGTVALAEAGSEATLNSAYATIDGSDTIYVFGAAGLSEAWTGAGEPATSEPLADGTWSVRAAYAFLLTL